MTEHRTSTVSTGIATLPPASPIASNADTRLLKKIHAIRPMLAARDSRKKLAAVPAI
jgi:hypothetical protein